MRTLAMITEIRRSFWLTVCSFSTTTTSPPSMGPGPRAVALTPPEWPVAPTSLRRSMLPSPSHQGLGLRSVARSWLPVRSLPLRPGNSPTILEDGRVDGLQNVGRPSSCHPTGRLALASINEQARCQSSVPHSVGVSLAITASYVRRKDFGQREISGRMQMFAGQPKFREGCKMFAKLKGNFFGEELQTS